MKCPHCLHAIPEQKHQSNNYIGSKLYLMDIVSILCSNCDELIITIVKCDTSKRTYFSTEIVYPRNVKRFEIDKSVIPDSIYNDYNEASIVLPYSPKASAALSRRCLQNIFHTSLKITKANLDQEIQEAINTKAFSSNILDDIDSIRVLGNFSAHPIKSTNTGEILEVEAGEAEWNLVVLEAIFDYVYVGPEKSRLKREAMNKKLAEAGKPALKTS